MEKVARIKKFDEIISFFDSKLRIPLEKIPEKIKSNTQEIRLRVNKCPAILCFEKTYFIDSQGLMHGAPNENSCELMATFSDIENYLNAVCNYSTYSFQEQIKNGFVTIKGGNRIGICGTAIIKNGLVNNIKNITSLNIRIANEFPDCSLDIFEKIKLLNGGILIAGPPKSGKTTILRDLAQKISTIPINNKFKKVVIADERLEISGTFETAPNFDIGFSDVLNGFSKKDAFEIAIRCFSPDTIICDEIGTNEDINTITESLNAGVQVIASIHARNLKELQNRPHALKILKSGAFEKIIFLENSFPFGKVKNIYDIGKIDL